MAAPKKVVIVGASLAGIRAASALRRGGFDGTLTLIGAEEHLPYDRPPLSKQVLLGKWEPERTALVPPGDIEKANLDLRLGRRATALDTAARTVTLDDGAVLAFDALIIATGATPRTLPGQPLLAGVHVLRTLEDSLAIREAMERGARVAVVGAGFIGAEVAAVARQRGLEVAVIETLSQPLERALGPRIGEACAALHRGHGADLRLGVAVEGLDGVERVERVRLSDGTVVEADLVVVGIGVRPETDWLEGSGLTLRDGVVCDETLNAGAPGVYAAGDICRWYNPLFEMEMRVEHWTNAVEQGMAAARAILAEDGAGKPFAPVPYVWSDQYDITIQVVGHPGPADELAVKHGALDAGEFVALFGRAGRLSGAAAFNMHRYLADYRRLIGNRATFEEAVTHIVEVDE